MTPEEKAAWKAHMKAVIARQQSPAGRALHRFATEWMNGTADRSQSIAPPAARPAAARTPRQPAEREQLLDAGLVFSVRSQDLERSAAEHRIRRRCADQERQRQERTWQRIRDAQGLDAADAWLRDQG
ncbi:hypothetical protein ACWEQO_29035 [Streptomyces sp. NPDC004051]